MTKHPLKGSFKSYSNHFDPQKDEQLKGMKIEIENQVQTILKLMKNINHGNKERNLRKKAEAIQLIEDFQKRYESLYSLHEDLREEMMKNFGAVDDDSSNDNSKVADIDNQKAESSDLEDTVLKDKLTSSSEVKKTMNLDSESGEINQVKDLEGKVASLKLEISTLSMQKSELEEQVKCKFDEVIQMKEKSSMIEARVMELEAICKESDCRFDLLRKQYEDSEKNYLSRISELVAKANEMEIEVSSLKHQKGELDDLLKRETTQLSSQVESLMEQLNSLQQQLNLAEQKKSYLEEEVTKISREVSEGKERVSELQMELEKEKQEKNEMKEVISKLRNENDQVKSRSSYSRSNFLAVERKVEEMAEDFRKQFEDQCRILSRRIRVAEQLHAENKEWCRKTKEAYEQECKELQERASKAEVELKIVKDLTLTANDVLTSLDSVALKFEECTANFLNKISKASCELKFVKHWATRKNKTFSHVKDNLSCLLQQLDDIGVQGEHLEVGK